MTEIEAMNTVTINPAKQLKIDQWVGSLEPNKQADFVVWSQHPLSTQAVCEETWIDGRQYFSVSRNEALLARDERLRQEIIQKILLEEDDPDGEKSPFKEHPRPNPNRDDISWEGGQR
jgi:adenine deaminase